MAWLVEQSGATGMSDDTGVPGDEAGPCWTTGTTAPEETHLVFGLVLLSPLLFTETFTREGLFGTTPFSGLHVVTVLLDFLNDVFRLHFALEAPKGIFQ